MLQININDDVSLNIEETHLFLKSCIKIHFYAYIISLRDKDVKYEFFVNKFT